MSQTLKRRDAPPFVHFFKNFDLLSSIFKFLIRHAQNHNGNMASLLKVHKRTWEGREDLYKHLVPTFDKAYTPLWKPFTDTKILVDQRAASLTDFVYMPRRNATL